MRELSPILWEGSIVRRCISEIEREDLARTKYWLCASKEVKNVYGNPVDDLYQAARRAIYALQLICPSGCRNVYLEFVSTPRGFDNIGSHQPREMNSTLLGRLTSAEEQGLAQDFEAVYAGVTRAFTGKIARLQNPVILLEHALQIGVVELSMLMCVMGLDMLFMAGNTGRFTGRLGGFLGPQSRTFPNTITLAGQPKIRVEEVISDLYGFRNSIAHGREVPKTPYREKYDLLNDSGGRINFEDYYYDQLMYESGLFLLARALRMVFVGGLVDDVKDEAKWGQRLNLFEHRYKNAAMQAPRPPRSGR